LLTRSSRRLVSYHALYHGYIKQAGCPLCGRHRSGHNAGRHSEEGGKALDPLKLQCRRCNQYECIHSPLRNQPRGDHGLSERGGGCQHSRIMGEHGMRGQRFARGAGHLGMSLSVAGRGCARPDHRLDVQIRQSLTDFISGKPPQSYVLGVILGTGNNPRLFVGSEAAWPANL